MAPSFGIFSFHGIQTWDFMEDKHWFSFACPLGQTPWGFLVSQLLNSTEIERFTRILSSFTISRSLEFLWGVILCPLFQIMEVYQVDVDWLCPQSNITSFCIFFSPVKALSVEFSVGFTSTGFSGVLIPIQYLFLRLRIGTMLLNNLREIGEKWKREQVHRNFSHESLILLFILFPSASSIGNSIW